MSQNVAWAEAKRLCEEDYHAKLLEIDSDAENTVVNDELKQRGHDHAWLGITDRRSEGEWVLGSTGQSPVFTAWRSGEPDNFAKQRGIEEDCGVTTPTDYKWNDLPCDHSIEYHSQDLKIAVVCEK